MFAYLVILIGSWKKKRAVTERRSKAAHAKIKSQNTNDEVSPQDSWSHMEKGEATKEDIKSNTAS